MIILDNVGVSLSTSNQQPVNGDPGKKKKNFTKSKYVK